MTTVVDELIVPTLRRLGEGWEEDLAVVGREHFGTNVLRTRLDRLVRSERSPTGTRCVAYCPEGELHEVAVLLAALVLSTSGYHVDVLGATTPWVAARAAIERLEPRVLLVGAAARETAEAFLADAEPDGNVLVVLGGRGFADDDVDGLPWAVRHTGPYGELPDAVAQELATHP